MRSRTTSSAVVYVLWAVILVMLCAGAARAQKADSVWIRNGDRITGEVKSLARGLLKYSTDDLGTISIEWDKVDRLSTRTFLEVQLIDGQKRYGPLGVGPPGTVLLFDDTLALADIVAMQALQKRLVDRVTGYLDLGFTFQKANRSAQLTTGGKATYRSRRYVSSLELTSFIENRDDGTETSRLSTDFTERVLLADRWSTGVVLGYDANEELDLAGRASGMAFVGRTLTQDNHIELLGVAGALVSRERYFSTDSSSTTFEGLVGLEFRAFRYDTPKLDLSISSQALPSFSVRGRVRLQNDLRVSYELIKDFMLTVTVFDSFDSKPPSADAQKNDFGTTLAVSWTF